MRLRLLALVPALSALLVLPGPAYPQTLPTHLQRLPVEAEVRLELAGGEFLRGRIAHHDSATLTIRRINRGRGHPAFLEHRIVALDSVVRGWTYDGNHWKRGTAFGAGLGVIGMLVASELSLRAQDDGGCNVGCWLGALGFGAAIGGGIGYLVGHAIPIWKEVGQGSQ